MGRLLGNVLAWRYRLAVSTLYRLGVLPWQLTLLSLVTNAVIGWLLLAGRSLLPGLLLVVAGLLDIFDGGVARLRREETRLGAFLDSVVDRISDVIVFGCLFWALSGQGRHLGAALALTSLALALLVSHLRAEAGAVGLSLTEGLMQRLERYVALIIGLSVPGALLPVLILLATLGLLTVAQRIASAWQQLDPS